MSATRMLPESGLTAYFDRFTKRFLRDWHPRAVDVEVLEPELGDQFPIVGARLLGIVYDTDTRVLELLLDSGDHRIQQPREVWIIEEQDGFLATMQIVHSNGIRELVSVRRVGLRRT